MTRFSQKFLLLKLKTKDPNVFGRFYDLYVKKIYRFVYFKVSSAEEAEDITAETFLKIWEYVFNNKKIDNLNAFTYQTARNLVIDFYRKKASQKMVVKETDEVLEQVVDPAVPIDQKLQLLSDVEQLEGYLKQMKEEYREVIIMRYLDELNISEIAKVLDKSNGNVRVLIHRAMSTLKSLIAKDNHEQ